MGDMTDRQASELLASIADCFDAYGPLPTSVGSFRNAILASDWLRDTLAGERERIIKWRNGCDGTNCTQERDGICVCADDLRRFDFAIRNLEPKGPSETPDERQAAIVAAIVKRRKIYADKAAKADPLAEDSLNRNEQFRHTAEAFDYLLADIGATDEQIGGAHDARGGECQKPPADLAQRDLYVSFSTNGAIRKWDWQPFEIDGIASTRFTCAPETPDERQAAIVAWLTGDEAGRGMVGFRNCWNIASMIESGEWRR